MERCTSTALMTVSLGDVVQQGLRDGREMMDSRRVGVLSSVVVASTTCLARSMLQYLL